MQILPRRQLIGSLALAAGGLALPGCATTRTGTRTGCLPRVNVDPSRVIRTVAGLRPFRPGGFVVRAEPLGDKRLVHNYGHGGAGITLSWGTSRLAVDLAVHGHQGPIAVIGAGVMGLTTARLVQEAGLPVTIYTKALPPDTTSNIAGGQFHPYGHFDRGAVTDAWHAQYRAALDYSWRRFQIMVGEDYGIRWLPTYAPRRDGRPEPQLLPTFPPANQAVPPGGHPFASPTMTMFTTLYIETGRFLRQLTRDVQMAGGHFVVREFGQASDLATLPEGSIVNCTGLGARTLFGDQTLTPIRGQLAVLLPQPEIRYAYMGDGYMFPRADGILLGGTFERDVWDATPQEADIAGIIATHQRIMGGWRCTARSATA